MRYPSPRHQWTPQY